MTLTIEEKIDIGRVWAGHPVQFALETFGEHQFVAFYDWRRRLTLGQRRLGAKRFELARLDERVAWDSHNYLALAVDPAGHVHLSGNMHNRPLVYFRSRKPLDIATMARVRTMTGRNESSVTYPQFFRARGGTLFFTFRDGRSGNGVQLYRRYSTRTGKWVAPFAGPLVSGEGRMNAYLNRSGAPVLGPDGFHHLVWIWRDAPDAATNHHICYAKSRDLKSWTRSDGTPIARPIVFESCDIVDPVRPGGGAINNNVAIGFDGRGRPVVSYHKFDATGRTQLFNARLEGGRWVRRRATDWTYRWAFGGGGSLDFKIHVSPVAIRGGELVQPYWHARHGAGIFVLDPRTLTPIARRRPDRTIAALSTPHRPRFKVNWARDSGRDAAADYRLRWETWPENRDHARGKPPAATALTLYAFA